MSRIWRHFTRLLLGTIALAVLPASAHAWEPNGGGLTRAVKAGDFTGYLANISVWLNEKTPAGAGKMSETSMLALLQDPVFAKALAQPQFIAKHGADRLGEFAKADPANARFLEWLLPNAETMDPYLIGATPTGLAAREKNDYTLPIEALELWRRIHDTDPDSRKGLYLKPATATARRCSSTISTSCARVRGRRTCRTWATSATPRWRP